MRSVKCGPVLDLGCGYGYGSFILRLKISFVVALEVDYDALSQYANVYYKGVEYVCADAQHLPFRSNAFKYVIALEVIEHVKNGLRLLKEVHRVLCRKGVLILSTPNKRSLLEFIYRKIPVIGRTIFKVDKDVKKNPYHVKEYDLIELVKLVSYKYRIKRIIGFIIPFLYRKSKFSKILSLYIAHVLPILASNVMIWAEVKNRGGKCSNTHL